MWESVGIKTVGPALCSNVSCKGDGEMVVPVGAGVALAVTGKCAMVLL